jgi:predicted house-cleaning noncanonical NTP pyrophosphatase (MazG superfamily)
VVEADDEKLIEELADVQEVIKMLTSVHGFNQKKVKDIQKRKRENRGGFEDGVFLESTK